MESFAAGHCNRLRYRSRRFALKIYQPRSSQLPRTGFVRTNSAKTHADLGQEAEKRVFRVRDRAKSAEEPAARREGAEERETHRVNEEGDHGLEGLCEAVVLL